MKIPNRDEKIDEVAQILRDEILSKLVELLEKKHLYQSARLNLERAKAVKIVSEDFFPNELLKKRANERNQCKLNVIIKDYTENPWLFKSEISEGSPEPERREIVFIVPTIKIPCTMCNAVLPPHHSGFKGLVYDLPSLTLQQSSLNKENIQLFYLPYQCQSCKGEPLMFLVRRVGVKLQLVGRSQFEEVQQPKFIPKQEQGYYSDAIISFNTGRTLAALFYLRIMIEQYMRRVLQLKKKCRGEELADKYTTLLADDFPKQRYKSLKKVYGELSEKIHAAKNDEKQFLKSLSDIENHFKALELIPLKKT